jgi:hypothetical protein
MPRCCRVGCEAEATGIPRIVFYPSMAFQRYSQNYHSIGSLLVTVPLCDEHMKGFDPHDVFTTDMLETMGDKLSKMADGIVADISQCLAVRCTFDHPDFIEFMRKELEDEKASNAT